MRAGEETQTSPGEANRESTDPLVETLVLAGTLLTIVYATNSLAQQWVFRPWRDEQRRRVRVNNLLFRLDGVFIDIDAAFQKLALLVDELQLRDSPIREYGAVAGTADQAAMASQLLGQVQRNVRRFRDLSVELSENLEPRDKGAVRETERELSRLELGIWGSYGDFLERYDGTLRQIHSLIGRLGDAYGFQPRPRPNSP
jgi:hypothetical protein